MLMLFSFSKTHTPQTGETGSCKYRGQREREGERVQMLKERLQIVFDAPIGQCFVIAAKSISIEFSFLF